MPHYEYLCKKCGESFTLTLTISEHDKKPVQCPRCNGTEVEQQVQPFFAKASRKS